MRIILAILTALAISGCATSAQNIGKSLLATKQTIVSTHEAFREPCKTGQVKADICKKVDELTEQAKPAYDAAVDAAILGLQSDNSTDALTAQTQFNQFAVDLTALAIQYGVKPAGGAK